MVLVTNNFYGNVVFISMFKYANGIVMDFIELDLYLGSLIRLSQSYDRHLISNEL